MFDLFITFDGRKDSKAVGSVFRAVRNRTRQTRSYLRRQAVRVMVDKLMMSTKSRWRRLFGSEHLADVIKSDKFQDGITDSFRKPPELTVTQIRL